MNNAVNQESKILDEPELIVETATVALADDIKAVGSFSSLPNIDAGFLDGIRHEKITYLLDIWREKIGKELWYEVKKVGLAYDEAAQELGIQLLQVEQEEDDFIVDIHTDSIIKKVGFTKESVKLMRLKLYHTLTDALAELLQEQRVLLKVNTKVKNEHGVQVPVIKGDAREALNKALS
jgi:hypothetical protein